MADNEGIDEKFEFSQLGDNPQHEIDEQFQQRVGRAGTKDMSKQGYKSLQTPIRKHDNILKWTLGSTI